MINLIPKEEKRKMTASFYYKLVLLFFLMFDFCLFILLSSIIPSYILSSVKNSSVNTKLSAQKREPLPLFDQQTLDIINGVNRKLDIVENAEKNKFLISVKVINAIILNKRPDIRITHILFNNDINGKKITISGTAPDRAILLLFRQSLEDNPIFKNVDLPISNFVKGSNIEFSLSLTPNNI